MAAKMPQPTTLQCISRPGSGAIHGARPRNMSCEMRVRNRISPIQMNSGSAVSAQEADDPQTVVAISFPAGESVNRTIASQPRPSSDSAIHSPPARNTASATSRMSAMTVWSIG